VSDLVAMPMKRPLPCSASPHILDDMEKTISMSQLAKDPERIARDIEKAGTVYRIRRPGRRSMMLVDQDYLEDQLAMYAFLARHPNLEQELEQGRRDFLDGKCIPIEDVMRDWKQRHATDEASTRSRPSVRGASKRSRAKDSGRTTSRARSSAKR
jgi:hypothetical protein